MEKHENVEAQIAEANKAVAELRRLTEPYLSVLAEWDRIEAGTRAVRAQQEALRKVLALLRNEAIDELVHDDPLEIAEVHA